MSFASRLIALPIHFYRLVLSPLKGPSCRYLPSCSDYALEALARHGAAKGLWLAIRRIGRCHPWGGFGYDPVPGRAGGGNHRHIPPHSTRPDSIQQAPASRASSSAR